MAVALGILGCYVESTGKQLGNCFISKLGSYLAAETATQLRTHDFSATSLSELPISPGGMTCSQALAGS